MSRCHNVVSASGKRQLGGETDDTDDVEVDVVTGVKVWLGLKNSDDVGTRFDLKAEVTNGAAEGYGELDNVSGGSSGFNNAHLFMIPITGYAGSPGESVSVTLWVRVACQSSHVSGTARLWWNDQAANSRVQAPGFGTLYLRGTNTLSPSVGPGPKMTKDVLVKKSGCPEQPAGNWKDFGTWTSAQSAQTITFTTTAPFLDEFGSYTPNATATSGLPVAITLDGASSGACSLVGGNLTVEFAAGFGQCVLDANQPGNAFWAPAPQVQQTVDFDSGCGGSCVKCVPSGEPGGPVCVGWGPDLFAPTRVGTRN